ncbi:hypothetical protein GALMADRAFT_149210 [Galerina marginata CBS 339.88]|uniref:Uncharacterized protein n=1 Tax=Galerina marginata (strain CBS 339.88) TaxID=685588 RepID=A0A067S4T0_GALM3|nr:hypothetical protein GALMADRAFT_149210 [Galerina marginata CBS 339.88]
MLSSRDDLVLKPLPKPPISGPRSAKSTRTLPEGISLLPLRNSMTFLEVPPPTRLNTRKTRVHAPKPHISNRPLLKCLPLQPVVTTHPLEILPGMPAIPLHPNLSIDSISTSSTVTIHPRDITPTDIIPLHLLTPRTPQNHSLPPAYIVEPPPCPYAKFRPIGPIPERVHPPADLNVLPGFQEIRPSLTRAQLYSPSTSSLIIPTDTLDIERVDFAWQYLGAIWIITFNLLIVKNMLSPGSRVLFGSDPANDVCYHLTRICYVYDHVLHIEAIAYNNRGCSFPKTSKDWPPIVIRLPRHKVVGFDAEIARAEADQARMRADTSLQPRWKFWLQPFFNKPIPVDPRDYYTPNPRRF